MKIKICGIKSLDMVEAINKSKPDYIGFIFALNSKRTVSESEAEAIAKKLDRDILRVGVFVNEDIGRVVRLCKSGVIDIVQLHGSEDDDYVKELKTQLENDIFKAIKVDKEGQIIGVIPKSISAVLVDYYSEKADGGCGKAFDWSKVDFTKFGVPVFLAGGIDITNLEKAKSIEGIYCLDCSSGVETDGKKDVKKIAELVKAVRNF